MASGGGLFAAMGAALDEALAAAAAEATAPPPPPGRAGSAGARPATAAAGGGGSAGARRAQAGAGGGGNADTGGDEAAVEAQAALATFYASCAAVFVFYFMRQIFALLFVAALGAAYLQNPARGPSSLRDAAWPPLLAARSEALSAATDAALQRGSVLSALRRTFMDGGVHLLRARRVLADFSFFAVAYFDSSADVDRTLCALGLLGSWHVLSAPWLRDFAAEHARAKGAEDDLNAAAAR